MRPRAFRGPFLLVNTAIPFISLVLFSKSPHRDGVFLLIGCRPKIWTTSRNIHIAARPWMHFTEVILKSLTSLIGPALSDGLWAIPWTEASEGSMWPLSILDNNTLLFGAEILVEDICWDAAGWVLVLHVRGQVLPSGRHEAVFLTLLSYGWDWLVPLLWLELLLKLWCFFL